MVKYVLSGKTKALLSILCTTLLTNFSPVNLQHSSCKYVFSIRVENSVDLDQGLYQKDVQCFQKG